MAAPKIVVAPDKFKGTLTAAEAAGRIAEGILRVLPAADVRRLPVADGGDGTVDAAVAAGFRRVRTRVAGPTGPAVDADFALRGGTAVVELAQASGLVLLPAGIPAPLTASSYGVGQLIAEAVRVGARRIVLGLGGSACTDGGAGMVQALGGRLLDAQGVELPPGGAALRDLDRVEATDLLRRFDGIEVVIASDVDNPLLGPTGAAAVYGPQKGAGPEDVPVLEAALARWAEVTGRDVPGGRVAGRPGSGAAGGVGFGALAYLGASLRPGIDLLLDLVGFEPVLAGAALVVTGEGRLDRQTLHGKAPAGVAAAAARAGVPVVAVCGRLELTGMQLQTAGIVRAYPLEELAADGGDPLTQAGDFAEEAGVRLAKDLLQEIAQEMEAAQ
ncbi:glycerate kinase [Yinghuangia seranimata]|uniref:glycerate kinase n=1 Tax=Yinghuangia seranimata TaxID=408067 RepID=UPI00248B5D56|nr:glycerate kinase [Yinghuangia seranimata]MDI2131514.1 glycerate kinase [Yinghuangia seranimata]